MWRSMPRSNERPEQHSEQGRDDSLDGADVVEGVVRGRHDDAGTR
jgi:hypothetical protein